MICLDFDWQIDEFMVYCRSTQLREKTMKSYEQTLRLFERWCLEQMDITTVDKVTESVIRHYIRDIQERGKYTFYAMRWKVRRKQTIQTAAVISESLLPRLPSTTTSAICGCSSTGWIGSASSREIP